MRRTSVVVAAAALLTTGAHADQLAIGPWNDGATKLAQSSLLATSSLATSSLATSSLACIKNTVATIEDPAVRAATEDAVFNADTCIRSRAGLDAAKKQAIVDRLVAESLIDETEAGRIPGGLLAGVFPGVRDDGTACPKLPMPYIASPGSVFGGHHSEPGGLAMHVAVNLTSAINLADPYRKVYGTLNARGMPVLWNGAGQTPDADLVIDEDLVIGTPVLHDWAKTIVFQWNADGSEYIEMNFGGNGKTDAWGAAGNTKTGAHHMIGIAESMARGMPVPFVITQASAHGAPNGGNEFSVVNWLRAAAIMAGQDPVERGYLMKDATGRLRLAAVRQLGSVNIQASAPTQSNLLYEYVLQNLSDADYTLTGPAVVQSEIFLRTVAPKFGYDPADATRYNALYRNVVLSHLSAGRVQILYANGGIGRVEQEVVKLKAAGAL